MVCSAHYALGFYLTIVWVIISLSFSAVSSDVKVILIKNLIWITGTLRRNLDPFHQNDDATLNSALRASGLFTLQTETDEARLTLDSEIASGGGNLSVGQRQIIALARAIVRNSKLLILDEGMRSTIRPSLSIY